MLQEVKLNTIFNPDLTHTRNPRHTPTLSRLSTRNNIRPSVLLDVVGCFSVHSGRKLCG
jgi:hypothetical protein